MMPTRYPRNPFASMFDQIESVMDYGVNNLPFAGQHSLQVDVVDNDEEIVVTADVPGFEQNELDLSVGNSGRLLSIRAQHAVGSEDTQESEEQTYLWQERQVTTIERNIPLPVEVREEEASANYTNGVLTITLPKIDTAEYSGLIDINWDSETEN